MAISENCTLRVSVSSLGNGMTLAQDVVNSQGLVLISGGTEVSQKQIKILKSWGIRWVVITSDADAIASTPTPVSPEIEDQVKQKLDQRFSLSNRKHPAVATLYAISLEQMLNQAGVDKK